MEDNRTEPEKMKNIFDLNEKPILTDALKEVPEARELFNFNDIRELYGKLETYSEAEIVKWTKEKIREKALNK